MEIVENTTSRVEETRKASSALCYRTRLKRLDKDPLLITIYCFRPRRSSKSWTARSCIHWLTCTTSVF